MKHLLIIITGLLLGVMLAACEGREDNVKYKLTFNDNIFESERTEYAAGEHVTVRYDIIATDTDYRFYSDDVEFTQNYDGGYVFTFVMPEHDVTLNVESHNSMEYDKDAYASKSDSGTAELSFETFDGGGPEFNVIIDDESIVSCETHIRYDSADGEDIDGAGKNVVIVFTAEKPGQTDVTIEERSPIADNLDRHYRVVVDDNLNLSIEGKYVRDINEVSEDMRLFINEEEVPVTWEVNDSVEELKTLCPLKIQMSMYGDFEQVGSLESSICQDDEQITTEFGDIVLYSGNSIVIFYGSNTWSYTRLGHVGLPKDELKELLGNGDVEIAIE